ncbi:carboxypeptidase-like regulatory domain-containing protein [Frigoriglobus tundricola]|uniref:Uncharacterized protein n=1 Tax=Frigoriglobus tundricola TaxID=2774151 RepID=A0A6M5Z1M1_9BACT|nr:carboxypeptidase-like regulatory domain-containing protein [Frigoriglobus tundricola]QJW99975.1 hypothetical protein FTUN_7598 [Frigoriglobus tundricola]
MSRPGLLVLVAVFAPLAGGADEPASTPLRAITTEGKPVAGAKVWVYWHTHTAEEPAEPPPLVADTDGRVSVPGKKGGPIGVPQLFARDSAGRIGQSMLVLSSTADPEESSEAAVTLLDTAERAGRVTAPDGKPVAGAVVTPTAYAIQEARTMVIGQCSHFDLPPWERNRLAARTDADGRFKLVTPALGYSTSYTVTAQGFGKSDWTAPTGVALDTKLSVPGTVTVTTTGIDPAQFRWIVQLSPLEKPTGEPAARPLRHFGAVLDAAGKVVIEDVVPGRYELTVPSNARVPGVFQKGEPFEVVPGKGTAVAAKFGPAARVTGRVTDKETGKGLAGADVSVSVSDGPGQQPREYLQVETDRDGRFTAHGPAGWYAVEVGTAPAGYSLSPPAGARGGSEPVKVAAGKSHEFLAPLALRKKVTFAGRVLTAEGKPAAGATVRFGNSEYTNRTGSSGRVVADRDGRFAVENLDPDDTVWPRVHLGKAANVPEIFELEKTTGPVTLEISEATAARFTGRVVDRHGKAVAGAKVRLNCWVGNVVGSVTTTTTDADGRYAFAGLWSRDRYDVYVTAKGYAEGTAKERIGEAGEVQAFADVRLVRANLAVSGTVVGPDGKPVAGVELFSVDGPSRLATASGADGRFTLTGFYEGGAFLFARGAGYRLAAVPVFPEKPDRVTVSLVRADAPPAPAGVSAEHAAQLEALARHVLALVWDNHEALGSGGAAVEFMARIDPATAKKWRDEEKKRTGGKTDFTPRIDRSLREKTLFATARDDIDEALAIIGALKAADGAREATRVGKRMLAVDRAKALRLAEEAVVRARLCEPPEQIGALAEAGDLAVRAGSAGGKRIIAEAGERAAKLTPDEHGRYSHAIGLAAANLAPHDWPKAEALLAKLNDPFDYNRYLSAAVDRVARTDPDRAKKLLDHFKPDNWNYHTEARLRLAFAIAPDRPDEAAKLFLNTKDPGYHVLGLIQLAGQFNLTDKTRAVKTIDAAFELLERDPAAFHRGSTIGKREYLAVVATVRAKQIGHPDVAALVARTLAMRPVGRDYKWAPDERDEERVHLAAVLALVDPGAARHLLAGIATPNEFLARAPAQSRDWLFALALADPERAKGLADKLLERAKAARGGQDALSETGLVELGSILTAHDRLRELAIYGNMPREIEDD